MAQSPDLIFLLLWKHKQVKGRNDTYGGGVNKPEQIIDVESKMDGRLGSYVGESAISDGSGRIATSWRV